MKILIKATTALAILAVFPLVMFTSSTASGDAAGTAMAMGAFNTVVIALLLVTAMINAPRILRVFV